jgi:hypothetical protein
VWITRNRIEISSLTLAVYDYRRKESYIREVLRSRVEHEGITTNLITESGENPTRLTDCRSGRRSPIS